MSYLSAPIRYGSTKALLQEAVPKVSSYFRHLAPCEMRQTSKQGGKPGALEDAELKPTQINSNRPNSGNNAALCEP